MVMVSRVGQEVEWAYAFDVHLNAFFPVLMILHCLQLFLINGRNSIRLKTKY